MEYNIIIYTADDKQGNKGYITYHKVSSISKFKRFANNKFPSWRFATVYDRKTRAKLEVIKP